MHHIYRYAHRLLYSTKHNKQEKQHSNLREDISKYKSTSHFRAALMVITSTTEIADHSWIIYNLDCSLRVTSTVSYQNNNTDSPILVLWFGRKFGDYSRVNNTLSLADTNIITNIYRYVSVLIIISNSTIALYFEHTSQQQLRYPSSLLVRRCIPWPRINQLPAPVKKYAKIRLVLFSNT